VADPVPDHSTLSRFRSELSRRGMAEPLLAELNRQLDARGTMVKRSTLIDASLVEADCRRPKKGELRQRRSDQDATWTPCRRHRCSAIRCTSRWTRARAWFHRFFSNPSVERLGDLLAGAGFRDIQGQSESREIGLCPFDDYFGGTEEVRV